MSLNYLCSFFIGGLLITGISYLAEKGLPIYAGLLMTFPVITLSSLLFLPESSGVKVAGWGLIGLSGTAILLGVYLISFHYLQMGKYSSLWLAFTAWLAVAGGTYVAAVITRQ